MGPDCIGISRRRSIARAVAVGVLGACTASDLPTASFRAATSPGELAVTFDASASRASGGDALTYLWNFGDGNSWDCPSCTCDLCRRDESSVTYTYAQAGRYRVTLVVVDENQSTDSVSDLVHPGNRRPTACLIVPAEANTNEPVKIDGACSSDDSSVRSYDFQIGNVDPAPSEVSSIEHIFTTAGTYTVQLVVTDDDRVSSLPVTRQIRVGPKRDTTPPTVNITSPRSGETLRGTVPLHATASDDNEVIRVEFWVNGQFAVEATSEPFTAEWDSRTISQDGTYELKAKAFDNANNVGESPSVSVAIRNRD